jgi:cytochrome c oxidase subunit 2
VACHVATTSTPDPNQKLIGPNLAHIGSRLSLAGGILENNDQNLARWLRNPQEVKPGTKMVLPNPLSEEDVQTLVRYLRSLQ